jgi:hypothetical protein
MADGQVRALCAQITLETNPGKCDALIAELTALLMRTTVPASPVGSFTTVFSLHQHHERKKIEDLNHNEQSKT